MSVGVSQEEKKRVLVVDDEPSVRDSLRLLLKGRYEIETAEDGQVALSQIGSFDPDIVLLDVMMPRFDGLETLKEIYDKGLKIPVIMLTAANTVRTAVQAMKYGAIDYLNKPFDVEELTTLIDQTLKLQVELAKVAPVQRELAADLAGDFGTLIGRSAPMTAVFQQVEQVAAKDTTVLITGESGTGKELIARQVHEKSDRSEQAFVPINCAAIPETLIESELFGHEKGAFTSAVEQRIGHFELANGGTLFLDEIGELSMPVQVKMLRFLQEQEFYRVGSSHPIRVDVRIIAATNKDLEELIREKKFRQDLYYRIHVINLCLPALRDRYEDIEPLIDHFIKKFRPVYGGRNLKFSQSAIEAMVRYNWPGNVRELENVVESLMALAVEEGVEEEHLPRKIFAPVDCEPLLKSAVFDGSMNFEEAEKHFERDIIVKALKKTNYVQTRAAELLGISRRILKYKMDKLGITEELEANEKNQAAGPNKGQHGAATDEIDVQPSESEVDISQPENKSDVQAAATGDTAPEEKDVEIQPSEPPGSE